MLLLNKSSAFGAALDVVDATAMGPDGAQRIIAFLRQLGDYTPTQLVSLPAQARRLGVASLNIKDEGRRLGLGSFKALGGAYAVVSLMVEETERRLGMKVPSGALLGPEVRATASGMTVFSATDGNHGRSVAWGANLVGARCVIFIHENVSAAREAAIAAFGAETVRVPGDYDDSVAEAAQIADRENWLLVSDTAHPGYERIPRLVMQGYSALIHEAVEQMDTAPTHVLVQAGVGGIAAAVAAYLSTHFGARRPKIIVVEPSRAACLFASAKTGHLVRLDPGAETVMAMLECREPSLTAWRILERAADAFMTVDDEDAVAAMRSLAHPLPGDPPIVAGESGGAGFAGLTRLTQDGKGRATLGLGAGSRVLVINTEGATDAAVYERLVGVAPQTIAAGLNGASHA